MSNGYLRIGGALLMGGILVLGTFLISRNSTIAEESAGGSIVSTAQERSYIAETDEDGDGVPDWQETLAAQVIDSIKLPSSTPEMGAGADYEKPTTFTGRFAEAFFTDYLSEKPGGEAIKAEDQTALITNALQSIKANTGSKIYTLGDIVTTQDSAENLHEYGNRMAEIINENSIINENEAKILKRALDQNDPKVLEELEPIRLVYEKILKESTKVPAPASLAMDHAALLSSYAAILNDITAMQAVYSDPLFTLARIQVYESDAKALYVNFKNIATKLISSGVSYEKEEPGALIYILDV